MSRITAHDLSGQLTAVRCVEADAYTLGAKNSPGIDLVGKRGAFFIVNAGTLGGSATIDAKLQDSPNNSDWTDVDTAVYGDADITQITTSDGDGETMHYSHGAQRWVRAVLTIGVATSDCGISAATY